MSLRAAIVQNTAIQAGGKMIGIGLSLITAMFMIRQLGSAGLGKYTAVIAFLQIFGILMDLGLYIILVKELATFTGKSSPVFNTIFTLRFISGVVILGIAPIIAIIVGRWEPFYSSEVIFGIALTTFFFLFISLNQLLDAIFQKVLRTNWIALGELAGKITLLAVTVTAVWRHWGMLPLLGGLVLSAGVNFAIHFSASRKYLALRFLWSPVVMKKVLHQSWPIALSILFTTLYFKGDSVILTFFERDEVIGWYGAPYKLLEVMITFPAMFAGLALPILTAAWKQRDHARLQRLLQSSFDAVNFIVMPLIVGTMILARPLIMIIAGEDFTASIPILRILILAVGAIFYGTLFGYLVVAFERQRVMLWGYGSIAVTSLALYLTLIPRFSIHGAAWVTVFSETSVALIAVVLVLRVAQVRLHFRNMGKSALAAAIMGVFLFGTMQIVSIDPALSLWSSIVAMLVIICAASLLHFGALVAFRALTWSEIRALLGKNSIVSS